MKSIVNRIFGTKIAIIKLIAILIVIITLFYSIKFNFTFSIFIYPFLLYYVLRNYSILMNMFFFSLIGFLFFAILYFYGFGQGFNVFIYVGFLSIFIFGLSGLITAILLKYYKSDNIISFMIFPLLFLIIRRIFLGFFLGNTYVLCLPAVLVEYNSILPMDVIIAILSTISIYLGISIIKRRKFHIIGVLLCIILIFLGSYTLKNQNKSVGNKIVKIASIQGNIDGPLEERIINAKKSLEYYIEKTKEAASNGAKIVVWPEYSVLTEVPVFNSLEIETQTKERLKKLAIELDIVIVYGMYSNTKGEKDIAIVIDPEKGLLKYYNAQKEFETPSINTVGEGNKYVIFDTKYGRFFILICYETNFLSLIDGFMNFTKDNPVDFVLTIANNQFLGESRVMNSIIQNNRVIAVMMNKQLISSTNTGPTVYIDKNGDIVTQIEKNKAGIMYSEVFLDN